MNNTELGGLLHERGLRPKQSGKGWQCRCPVHKDDTPSLSATVATGGRLLLFCHAGCPFPEVLAALNLPKSSPTHERERYVDAGPSPLIVPNWRAILKSDPPGMVEEHERKLGIPMGGLRRIGVAWAVGIGALAAPMYAASGIEPIGIRLRADDGRKWAMQGSKNGLFRAAKLHGEGSLFVPEGFTDTAALAGLGLDAIGRPSCSGGRQLLRDAVRLECPKRRIVVVADRDEAGQNGADLLSKELVHDGRTVCVLTPPGDIKDAREWVRRGATRASVEYSALQRMYVSR